MLQLFISIMSMNFTSSSSSSSSNRKRRRINNDIIDNDSNDKNYTNNIDSVYSNDDDESDDYGDDDDDDYGDDDDDDDYDDYDDYDYDYDYDYDNESDSYEDEEEEEDIKFCIICDDNEVIASSFNNLSLKANDLYPSCHHSCHFCIQCIQRVVSDKIKESAIGNMVCPLPGCKQKFDHEFIKAITSDDEYIKYQQDIMSLVKGRRSFLNILSDFRSNAFRGVSINCKRCPNCYYIIEKDGGCNHMQCMKCSFEFYWCCRQEWTPIHNEEQCFFNMYILPLQYLFLSPLLLIIVFLGLSFLGKALYLMLYLVCVVISCAFAIFLLRLKDPRENNEHLLDNNKAKECLMITLIFLSIMIYLTSDNIIASYMDLNENDGFRLLLLLPLFQWDTWDIYKMIYSYRSNDQIVNIMVSFIITYATNGSVLCHTSYVIPFIFNHYKNLSIADRNVRVTMITIAVVLEVVSIIRTSSSIRTSLTVLTMLLSYLFIPFHYSQFPDVYISMGFKRFRNDVWLFIFWCMYIGSSFSTVMYKPLNTIGALLSTILVPMMPVTKYIGLFFVPLLMTLLRFTGTIFYRFIWVLTCIQTVSKSDSTARSVRMVTKEGKVDYDKACIMLKGWCTDASFLIVTLVPSVYIAINNNSLYERMMNAVGILILDLIFCQLGLIDNNNNNNNNNNTTSNKNGKIRSVTDVIAVVKDRVNRIYTKIFCDSISLIGYSQYFWIPLLPSLLNNLQWITPMLYVILLGLTLLGPLYYLTYIR